MMVLSLVVFCQHCQAVCANLVSGVPVVGHPGIGVDHIISGWEPVTASDNTGDCSRSKKSSGHAVG